MLLIKTCKFSGNVVCESPCQEERLSEPGTVFFNRVSSVTSFTVRQSIADIDGEEGHPVVKHRYKECVADQIKDADEFVTAAGSVLESDVSVLGSVLERVSVLCSLRRDQQMSIMVSLSCVSDQILLMSKFRVSVLIQSHVSEGRARHFNLKQNVKL